MTKTNSKQDAIRDSLRLGTYLLVIVSGVALFLTQKLYVSSSILLVVTGLALCFVRRPRGGSLWEIASFLYLLFFFADWFWITRSLAPSLVHLFIFIIINKLFNLQTDRDYYQLYLLAFLSMLAASSLSVEIEMLGMIILFVLLFVWNIMSITVIKIWSKMDSKEPFPFSLFGGKYLGTIGIAVLLMLSFALGIFFILPRTQLGYFGGMKPGQTQHVSGFSQKVQLGDIAQIQENTGEVMRVRVTTHTSLLGHRFYWRGIGFDTYDGKSWSTSNRTTSLLLQDSTNLYVTSTNINPDSLVKQEIYVAPIDSRVIFGQDRIVKLDGNFFAVSRDVNNTLLGMGIPEHYDVYSLINMASAEELRLRHMTYSENVKRYYTKLSYRDPRIDNLAHEITKNATTVYDQAMLIQNFLEKNYRYTTVNLPQSAVDPVSTFLFSKKMGHCEYFATSMVLLLRHLGIPSRLVNGFLEGEYNEIGDFYIVRQSDAHTWAEVYFGNGLWVTFDPSPRDVGEGSSSSSFWHLLNPRKILDSISFFWDRYILIFSAQDQIDMLSSVRDRYRDVNRKLRESTGKMTNSASSWRIAWEHYRYPIVFIVLFVLMIYLGYRFRKQQKWRMELIRSPILFYQQMLLQLQRKGLEKRPATTPAEFVHVVARTLPSASDDVASITSLFYKARFGNYVLSMEDQAFIQSALSRLSRNQ
jgi:transglutaminase-like putative cysteine protease